MESRAFQADDLPDLREPVLKKLWPLCGLLAAVPPAPTLAQTDTLLPEISVSAEADPGELRRNAATAKIVFGREDIEALDAGSVGEVLRKLPGTGLFADMEGKRGRGKGPDKMMPLILVDGEPLPGGERNPMTALRLAPELVERIEVIRNGGAEYPSAGPGGIINLILRDVPPKPSGSVRGGLGQQDGGSVLRVDGQHGERDAGPAGFGWLLAGSAHGRPLTATRAETVQQFAAGARSAWTLENARESGREEGAMFTPRFTWNLAGGGQFILSPFLAANQERRDTLAQRLAYADPVAGTGLAAAGSHAERDSGRRESLRLMAEWRAMGRAAAPWTELSLRLMLQGEQEAKHKQRREFDAAGALTADRAEEERRAEREAGFAFKGKRLVGEAHVLGLGGEVKWKTADDDRLAVLNGASQALGANAGADQRERRAVFWAQDEWQLAEQHLLTAGLRTQWQRARVVDGLGAALERASHSVDPSLHYLWQPDPAWNLRTSVSRQRRAPGLKDISGVVRSASGINASSNPDKAGNPALSDIETLGFDAGIEHFLAERAGSMGLSTFCRRVEGQVQRLTLLEGGRWVERPYNVGTALMSGLVADAKLRLDALDLPQLTLRGNLAATRSRLLDTPPGLGAGEGPRRSWNLGADYEWREAGWSLGGNINGVAAIDRDNTARLRQTQGARQQIDLYARKRLDRQLALRLSLTNIGRPERRHEVEELDAAGSLARTEHEAETTAATIFFAIEGRW